MENILEKHKRVWENKKLLRLIYSKWYKIIISDLKDTKSVTVELGSGTGNFKEFKPDVISADIDPKPWLDMVFDAHKIPFGDNTVGNLVLIDVLHHLYNPILFLNEASRVLEKGGKLIMLEPFPSLFSLAIYRRFHPEPFIMTTDYFSLDKINIKDPWDSNQAIPYLLFFKHKVKFFHLFKDRFKILKKEKMSFILYPASGGFENKSLIADWLIPFFEILEFILTPFKSLLAFRCYIVLEKI